MKIGIVGYGKMGKEIERVALEQGNRVVWKLDLADNREGVGLTPGRIREADVCIEFTTPDAAAANVTAILSLGGKVVSGTTGWYDHLNEVDAVARRTGGALVHGSNFSIGAYLFREVATEAARLFAVFPDIYDVALHEIHHRAKVDHPSGTALALGQDLVKLLPTKTLVQTELDPGIGQDSLHVSSTRVGHFPGMHTVFFDGPFDTIEIRHTARTRAGFVHGALLAARWIEKAQGIFDFPHVMKSILEDKAHG